MPVTCCEPTCTVKAARTCRPQRTVAELERTVAEIERAGLRIRARIPVEVDGTDGVSMAAGIATQLAAMVRLWQGERPSMVVVMGDRGEMLAGALAAIHLNIPVVHIHGGERSGTVDEPVRHAISKLAHYHFAATEGSRARLVRMGEREEHVFVTGAPGLDGLPDLVPESRAELCAAAGLDPERPVALVIFHPVLQTSETAGAEMTEVLEGVIAAGPQVLCFLPNSDAGGQAVRRTVAGYEGRGGFQIAQHVTRDRYLSWLARADVMAGNSSSGIIEAASFGLPVVNVGDRQHGRERNANTDDVEPVRGPIEAALRRALHRGRKPEVNVYGDGRAAERIAALLATLPLTGSVLKKSNAY
jgi:GDP/UDP-N,N'-diacetylbacillosamine 2-epimerase (hydrolysing)